MAEVQANAAPEVRLTSDRPLISITSPVSGEVVGRVPRHSAADVADAVQRARSAQPDWAALSFRQRAQVIVRFHDLLLKGRESLFDVIQSEAGKSRRDAFVEMFAVACEARFYAYHGGKYLKPRRIKSAIPLRDRSQVRYHPVGVVGIASPWNFPLILSVGDAIPALLAGNAVVLKPASLTPLTALWARDRLVEAGLPADLFQVLIGPGSELVNPLVDQVNYVMFTGSTEVGRKVAERAAHRLIPYSMELGGKNAVIILPDADIKHAVYVVIEGTFNNCGQVCVNFERAYVHERVHDAFVDALVRETERVRLGAGRDFSCDISSLISADQLATVQAHIDDAVSKGARVLSGGRPRPDLGPYFFEPTILADVTPDMTLYAEETFGPVLSVYKVRSEEEAIRLANDSRYGLNYAVITRNVRRGEQVAAQLQAGTVCVNDSYMSWAAMEGPLGGFKESGVGRRHGPEGIRKYTEAQTIVANLTPWQIGSYETALSVNERLVSLLARLLRVWRHIPFLR